MGLLLLPALAIGTSLFGAGALFGGANQNVRRNQRIAGQINMVMYYDPNIVRGPQQNVGSL